LPWRHRYSGSAALKAQHSPRLSNCPFAKMLFPARADEVIE
jgi:hypothetical protein